MSVNDLVYRLERRREQRRARLVRWPVRVGVWVLFLGVVGGGFTALGGLPGSGQVPRGGDTVVAAPVSPVIGPGIGAQEGPVVVTSYCSENGEPVANPVTDRNVDCTTGNVPPGFSRFRTQPIDALPAWRWNKALGAQMSNLGNFEVGKSLRNSVGSVMFEVSSVLWGITSFLINFADRADFFKLMSGSINDVFVKVAAATWPLLALGYLLVLLRISREVLRGDAGGVIRLMAGFVIPAAFITVMVQSVNDSGNFGRANGVIGGQGLGTLITGSPAWMANQVIGALDESGKVMGAMFQPVAPDSNQLLGGNNETTYSCRPYIDALTATYNANTAGSASGGPSLMISQMWLASSYEMWSQAVFGDQLYRHKASCHAAEWWSGIPVGEQKLIANAVYPGGETGWHNSVFGPTGRDFGNREWSEEQWHFGMWQACTADGIEPEWKNAVAVFDVNEDAAKSMCTKWRNEGMDKDSDIDTVVEKLYMKSNEISDPTVSRWIQASLGKSNEMLLMGFGSLLSSIVYLWAFAGLAIGVIASKLGLVIALMMLPFTLTLIGLGMESGGRLLRWTASLCAIDLVFTAVMALLLLMTTLGVSLLIGGTLGNTLSAGGVQAGLGRALSVCLVPIGAVMATNKVLKQAGLGAVTRPTQALGLVGRASAKAYQADTTSGYMRAGYKNKKERALERYQQATGAVTGAQAALDRVTDPFNTGRTKLKREAASANKLAAANPGNAQFEKAAAQSYVRWRAAEDAHDRKVGLVTSAPRRAGQIVSGVGKLGSAAATATASGGSGLWPALGMAASGLGDLKAGIAPEDREALEARHKKVSVNEEMLAQAKAVAGAGGIPRSSDETARQDAQGRLNKEYQEKTQEQVFDPLTGELRTMQMGSDARAEIGSALLAAQLAQLFAASLGDVQLVADLRNGDVNAMANALVNDPTRNSLSAMWAQRWGVDQDKVLIDDYGNAWLNRGAFSDPRSIPEELRDRPEANVDAATWAAWSQAAGGDGRALAMMVGSQMVASGYARVEGDQAVLESVSPGAYWDLSGASPLNPEDWGRLFVAGGASGPIPGRRGVDAPRSSYEDILDAANGGIDLGDGATSAELQHIISGGRGSSASYGTPVNMYTAQAAGVGQLAAAAPQAAANVNQVMSGFDDLLGQIRDTFASGVRVNLDPMRVQMDETARVKLDPGSIAEVGSVIADAVSGMGMGSDTTDLGDRMSEAVDAMRQVGADIGLLAAGVAAVTNGPSMDGSAELGAMLAAIEGVDQAANRLADAAANNDMEAVRQILEQFVGQMSGQTAAAQAVSSDLSSTASALAEAARAMSESTARYGDQPSQIDVSEVVAELQGIRAALS